MDKLIERAFQRWLSLLYWIHREGEMINSSRAKKLVQKLAGTVSEDVAMNGNSVFLEELEVLQAIYEDELALVKSDDSSAETKITIHPSTADDKDGKYVCLTLHFFFTFSHDQLNTYPNKVPDTSIKNPRGISDSHLASIEENMRSLVKNMVGEQMMFSLIEYARESLSDNNHPSCVCPICLDKFEEGELFFRTECYHYFHRACIKSYVEVSGISEILVCPVCRLEFQIDESILNSEVNERSTENEVVLDKSFYEWRQQFEHLYEKQKRNGGIIDLEAEKNKFLITLTDSRPESPATVNSDTEMSACTNEPIPVQSNEINSPKLRSTKHTSESTGRSPPHSSRYNGNLPHKDVDKNLDFKKLDIKDEMGDTKDTSGSNTKPPFKNSNQNRVYKNEKYYRDSDSNRSHDSRNCEKKNDRGGYRQRGNRHHQYRDDHSHSRHRESDDSHSKEDRNHKNENSYRRKDYEKRKDGPNDSTRDFRDNNPGNRYRDFKDGHSNRSRDDTNDRSRDFKDGPRDRSRDFKDGPSNRSRDFKDGPSDRSRDFKDGPSDRSRGFKDGPSNRSRDFKDGPGDHSKDFKDGPSDRSRDFKDGPSNCSRDFKDGPSDRSRGFKDGHSDCSRDFKDGPSNRSRDFNDGPSDRSRDFKDGPSDRSRGFKDGHSDRSRDFKDGPSDRSRDFKDGPSNCSRDFKDGPGDHSKDFKDGPSDRSRDFKDSHSNRSRYLNDGLSNRPRNFKDGHEPNSLHERKNESKVKDDSLSDNAKDQFHSKENPREKHRDREKGQHPSAGRNNISRNDNRPQSSKISKSYDSKPHHNQRRDDKESLQNSKVERETNPPDTTGHKEKRPPPGFSQMMPERKLDKEHEEQIKTKEENNRRPPPGFENSNQPSNSMRTRTGSNDLQKPSQTSLPKPPPGFHKGDRDKSSMSDANNVDDGRTQYKKSDLNDSEGKPGGSIGGNRNRNRRRQAQKPPQDKL